MMAPTQTLTLTYALQSGGEQRRPSPYLMAVRSVFPRLTTVDVEAWSRSPGSLCSPAQALERFLTLREEDPLKEPLRQALLGDERMAERLKRMEEAVQKTGTDAAFAHPELARQLYGRGLSLIHISPCGCV